MSQSKMLEEKTKQGTFNYILGNFLGKGGFAKCFQATKLQTQEEVAIKIISKENLVKNRAKQKLLSQIKIHRALNHCNIVKFKTVFEDEENVYIVLQLCTGRSVSEMVKKRKYLTPPEARYYLFQLLSALEYLHANKVIHRDLKMANIFLSENMEIKLGDFGLSAKLEFSEERKRTMAGTPNYIAPEIIDGTTGHSYEVDLWSTGIICYALLFGRPPFETSQLKMTYARIKNCQYTFPNTVQVPSSAKDFIKKTLVIDPKKRMNISEMYQHPFMKGQRPIAIPRYASDDVPTFTKEQMIGGDQYAQDSQASAITTPITPITPLTTGQSKSPPQRNTFNVLTNSAQLNKQVGFQSTRFTTLYESHKLSAQGKDPKQKSTLHPISKEKRDIRDLKTEHTSREKSTAKELVESKRKDEKEKQKEKQKGKEKEKEEKSKCKSKSKGIEKGREKGNDKEKEKGKGKSLGVYVIGYVDYSTKYGLGYYLDNGCMGVYFNDSTIMSIQERTRKYSYFQNPVHNDKCSTYAQLQIPTDHNFTKKKMLMHKFQSHLKQEQKVSSFIQRQSQQTLPDPTPEIEQVFIKQWLKTKYAIMFRLSNKIFQVDFFDNSQILLRTDSKEIKFTSKKGEEHYLMLSDALHENQRESQLGRRIKYTKEILNSLKKDHGDGKNKGGQS